MKKVISCVLLMLVLTSNALALEVPTDTVVQNLNGSQQAIKTFTVYDAGRDRSVKLKNIGGITMLNKIILMGRLTRDPELRRTESGTAVCSFSIAVDRDFKSKNGEKETDFIDIVSWRATAEFVSKYFTKGRMAVVEGRLQIRDWTDKEGGKRRSAEVIADNVYFGDSKPKDGGEEDDIPAYTGAPDSFAVPDGFTPDFGGESGEMPF